MLLSIYSVVKKKQSERSRAPSIPCDLCANRGIFLFKILATFILTNRLAFPHSLIDLCGFREFGGKMNQISEKIRANFLFFILFYFIFFSYLVFDRCFQIRSVTNPLCDSDFLPPFAGPWQDFRHQILRLLRLICCIFIILHFNFLPPLFPLFSSSLYCFCCYFLQRIVAKNGLVRNE